MGRIQRNPELEQLQRIVERLGIDPKRTDRDSLVLTPVPGGFHATWSGFEWVRTGYDVDVITLQAPDDGSIVISWTHRDGRPASEFADANPYTMPAPAYVDGTLSFELAIGGVIVRWHASRHISTDELAGAIADAELVRLAEAVAPLCPNCAQPAREPHRSCELVGLDDIDAIETARQLDGRASDGLGRGR
jgi:hypothetical protein